LDTEQLNIAVSFDTCKVGQSNLCEFRFIKIWKHCRRNVALNIV
jgi:hypothetical protein